MEVHPVFFRLDRPNGCGALLAHLFAFLAGYMSYLKKKFRSIKKLPTWLFWLPARLMQLLVRVAYRVRIEDPYDHLSSRGAIALTWHNRLFTFPTVCPAGARRRTVAIVSASRDGQYVVDLIHYLGLRSLRGSSSRRGASVLLEATAALKRGDNVAITPDGPRGPRYRIKTGPVALASATGAKIIPVSINASKYWAFRSWDGFQIPKPGAVVTLVLGEGIRVAPDLSREELERERQRVEAAMLAITRDEP